jgi:hypothetical protein
MLKEKLANWTDFDVAQHAVAVCLGLMKPDDFNKGVFWTRNPLGKMLGNVLETLVEEGFLEKNEEEGQYRYNPQLMENET